MAGRFRFIPMDVTFPVFYWERRSSETSGHFRFSIGNVDHPRHRSECHISGFLLEM